MNMNKKNKSTKNPHAPHDLFFKDIFSQKPFAIELLKLILSPEEQKLFHFHTLKNEKTTFKSQRADLIFSIQLKALPFSTLPPAASHTQPLFPCEKQIFHKSTSPHCMKANIKPHQLQASPPPKHTKPTTTKHTKKAFIFLVLEHKSQKEKTCLVQILKYQALLYSQLLKENAPLVPLIPIIFYHGKEEWHVGDFQDLFPKHVFSPPFESFFGKNVLNFHPRVLNLNSFDEKALAGLKTLKSGMALYLLKKIWYFKWPEDGKKMLNWVQNLSARERHNLLLVGSEYIKDVCKISQKQLETLELEALKTGILRKGGSMGLLEYVRQKKVKEITQAAIREGLQKGMKQGKEQGMKQGKEQGMKQVALNMLHNDLDVDMICKVTGLCKEEVHKLNRTKKPQQTNST